jgi:histidyl-tRNA synthetase
MTFQALPGFRDFPPEDLAFRSHIQAAWRRVATRYGFAEYDGPPLEPQELYTAKSGDEIVGQLFNFVDKGGRQVALRPEMTPTFARMVSEHAKAAPKPIRWFSTPQLFRYEKQQKGRLREHFQLNCDLVGEAGPLADAEVIALAIDVCRELGLTSADLKVRLSDRRLMLALLERHGIVGDAVSASFEAIDKLDRAGSRWAEERLGTAGFSAAQVRAVLDLAQVRGEIPMGVDGAAAFVTLYDALRAQGLAEFIEIDLSIVRGLAYYTGTVFELFDRQGTHRAICGGGRYDNLLESLGGVNLPAVGFGMGDVVLGELLKERGLRPAAPARIECYVAGVSTDDRGAVLALAHRLRDGGIATEFALNDAALGKQLKQASARGARLALVVGPEDRAAGVVQVKDLASQAQQAVALADVVGHCRTLLTSTG